MEYKIRHIKKRKARRIKNREEAGFVRIKIRGRKRWIKSAKPAVVEEKKD